MGGVVDDVAAPAPIEHQASLSQDGQVVLSAEDQLRVEASSIQQPGVAVETRLASLSADGSGVQASLGDGRLDVPLAMPDLLGTSLPTDGALDERPDGPTSPPQSAAPTTQASAAAAPAAPGGWTWALAAAQAAAPAAALAALAVYQSNPSLSGLKRFWPVLTLYSRIPRNKVLDHQSREAIYELITDEPGLSLGEITERLDLSRSTARHHVGKLEEAGLVRHSNEGRCRIHFPVGREEEAVAQHLLSHPQRARIAELLETRPLSLMELAAVLDANAGAVHFHLNKLREAGLIERRENGSVTYRRCRST